MNENLYHRFSQSFPEDGRTPVLIDAEGVIADYHSLDTASARYANLLTGMGALKGDRVTVQVEKSVDALFLYLGCIRAGLVFHPLNTAYQEGELAYFLENAEPRIVVGDKTSIAILGKLAATDTSVITIDLLAEQSLAEQDQFETALSEKNDVAALLYSSGTTGVPKGIMLSHGNLAANAETLVSTWGFSGEDVLLHALPIYHVHGLFVGIGCVLMSGAGMYWINNYGIDQILSALPSCSVMMGVPTYYTRLLRSDAFTKAHCENMRLFISGSAPLLTETFEAFESRTGHLILERYGMTETGMNSSNPLDGERVAGTVGPALPDVEIRVTDADDNPLKSGEVGAVQVRGPNVFQGYWKLPEKTREDFTEDGFFDTGDQGMIDAKGYLSIIGREKDMIISGGLNIYPKEIELLLDQLTGVSESAVFGVAHADFGEGVVAAIVETEPGSLKNADIIQSAKSQIAGFKVPKAVIFLEELPRNAMGKVQKKQLRDTYKDLLS
ncbi:MAG: AMP-binding protein [Gammaproteobacteria bacterium]|nr:AMP-binding protein [Gammaproteobacteria bacterium]